MYLHISICSYNDTITDTIATYVMYQEIMHQLKQENTQSSNQSSTHTRKGLVGFVPLFTIILKLS